MSSSSSSQAKITLRPPPHVDFIQGYPGIPSLSPSPASRVGRPSAHIAGTVEVRLGSKGLRAAWLRIELRKLETVAGENWGELIGRGPIDVWTSRGSSEGTTDPEDESAWDILQTADFPFRISIPEGLPPSARIDKGCSISYELVTSLCIRAKKGLLKKEATSSVIQSTHPITIDKHELHCTWPIYNMAETHESTTDNIRAKVYRPASCYSPGDTVDVRVIVFSNRVNPAKIKSIALSIRETVTFRGAAAGSKRATLTGGSGKAASQKSEVLVQRAKTVGKKIYKGDTQMFDLQVNIPKTHTLMTIQTAKHVEVSYTMRVTVDIKDASVIVDHLPITMSSFSRAASVDIIKRIGYVAGLSDIDDSVSTYPADDDQSYIPSDASLPSQPSGQRHGTFPLQQETYAQPSRPDLYVQPYQQVPYTPPSRQDSFTPAPAPNLSRSQSYDNQSRYSSGPQRQDTMYSAATRSSVSGPGLAGRGAIGVNGSSGMPVGQPGQVFSWGAYGGAQPYGPDGANGGPALIRSAFAGPGTFHESDNLAPEENRALFHSPLPSDIAGVDASENRFYSGQATIASQGAMRASPPPMTMHPNRIASPGPTQGGPPGTYPQNFRASIAAYPDRNAPSPHPLQQPHMRPAHPQSRDHQQPPMSNPHLQSLRNAGASANLPNGRPASVPSFASNPQQTTWSSQQGRPSQTSSGPAPSADTPTPASDSLAKLQASDTAARPSTADAAAAAAAAAASAEAEKTRLYERARQQAERNQRRADERRARLAAAANGGNGTVDTNVSGTTMHRSASAGTVSSTLTPDGYGGLKTRSPVATFSNESNGGSASGAMNMTRVPTLPSLPSAEVEKMRLYEHARKEAERYQAGYKMGASFPKDAPGSPMRLRSGNEGDVSGQTDVSGTNDRSTPQRRESAAFWMTESGPQRVNPSAAPSTSAVAQSKTVSLAISPPPAVQQQGTAPLPSSSASATAPRILQGFPSAEEEKRRLYEAAKRETEAHLRSESTNDATASVSSASSNFNGADGAASSSASVPARNAPAPISAADEKEQMRRFYEAKEAVERKSVVSSAGQGVLSQGSSASVPQRKPTYGPGSEPYETAPLPTYDAVFDAGATSSAAGPSSSASGSIHAPAVASGSASGSGTSDSRMSVATSEKEQLRLYYAARDAQAASEVAADQSARNAGGYESAQGRSEQSGDNSGPSSGANTSLAPAQSSYSASSSSNLESSTAHTDSKHPTSTVNSGDVKHSASDISAAGPSIPARPAQPRRTGSVMGGRPLPGSGNQTPRTGGMYSPSIDESSAEPAGSRQLPNIVTSSVSATLPVPPTVPPQLTTPLVAPPPGSDLRMPGSSADAWAVDRPEGLPPHSSSSTPFVIPPLDFGSSPTSDSAIMTATGASAPRVPPPPLPASIAAGSFSSPPPSSDPASLGSMLGHLAKSGSEYGPRMPKAQWWEDDGEVDDDHVALGKATELGGKGGAAAGPPPPPLPPKTAAVPFL